MLRSGWRIGLDRVAQMLQAFMDGLLVWPPAGPRPISRPDGGHPRTTIGGGPYAGSNDCACQGRSIASRLVKNIADYETVQLEWPIRTRDFTVTAVAATTDDRVNDLEGTFTDGEPARVQVPAEFLPPISTAQAGTYVLDFSRLSSLRGDVVVAVTSPSLQRIGYSAARIADLQLNARINHEYQVLMQEYYNGHDPTTMSDIAWSIAIAGPQALRDDLILEAMEEGDSPDEVHAGYDALHHAMRVLIDRAVRYQWWPSPVGGRDHTLDDEYLHDRVPLSARHALTSIPGLDAIAERVAVKYIAGLDSTATDEQVTTHLSEMWSVDRYAPMVPGSDSQQAS